MTGIVMAAAILSQTPAMTGINMTGNKSYGTARIFVDYLMTVADNQAWLKYPIVVDANGRPTKAAVDSAGYPTEDARANIYMAHAPQGTYTFTWTGNCTITFVNKQRVVQGATADAADGSHRMPVTITGTDGMVFLQVTQVDPANPPRNFHLITPGYDPDNYPLLQTDFTRRYRLFDGYRYGNVMGSWDVMTREFDERIKPTDWQGGYVAWENVVAISNLLMPKYIWLHVPYHASDDCQDKMSNLFLSGVNPAITVYVELSDEIWNSVYEESKANRTEANDATLHPELQSMPSGQRPEALHAVKVANMSKIWKGKAAALGQDPRRVRIVYAGQNAVVWRVQTGLKYLQSTGIRPADVIDCIACAAYVSIPKDKYVAGMTADQIFPILQENLDTIVVPGLNDHAQVARDNGVDFVVYEWGQSLMDTSSGRNAGDAINIHDAASAAQDDPRMGTIMKNVLTAIDATGAKLANHYDGVANAYGIAGYWALMQFSEQSGSVKYDAIMSRLLPTGDVDQDRDVDYFDYLMIAANQGKSPAWREDGDLTGDGKVDSADVSAWAAANPAVSDPQRAAVNAAFPSIAIVQHR